MKFDYRYMALIPIVTVPAFFEKSVLMIVGLIALTILFSWFASKTKLKNFGLELVTFTTIITGVMFGVLPGAVIGAALMLVHSLICGRIASYLIFLIPLFGVVGAAASLFSWVNIVVLGVGLTVFSHIAFICWQKFSGKIAFRYIPYLALNGLFNFFLFSNIAPKLIGF